MYKARYIDDLAHYFSFTLQGTHSAYLDKANIEPYLDWEPAQ